MFGKIFSFLLVTAFGLGTVNAQSVYASEYTSEDVTFYNDTIRFGGTISIPTGSAKAPAVVILSGTGKQDRDGVMAGHKMFVEIADYLASRGIAVLRFDDRGTGESTGSYDDATTMDFADDAMAAISFLKTRNDIDTDKLGLIGHSEGGAAMSIAASKTGDVKYMVSLAGLCLDGINALIQQNHDLVRAYDMPDYNIKRYDVINELMFRTAHKYADSDSLESKLFEAYDKWAAVDSLYFSTLGIEHDHFRFPIYMYAMEATNPWYRFHVRYNPADYLKRVHIPVLALNGDKDLMVNAELNLAGWKNNMPEGADVTTITLKGLNHLFLPCTTGSPQEYNTIEAPLSTEMLRIVCDWIADKTSTMAN